MKPKKSVSRRDFVKTTTFASGIMAGGLLNSCSEKSIPKKPEAVYLKLPEKDYEGKDAVAGLLFSQVGYEIGFPVKIIIRLPEKDLLSDQCECRLNPTDAGRNYNSPVTYWGEVWQSHWWIAEFKDIDQPGEWEIEVTDNGKILFRDQGLIVKDNVLIKETMHLSSADMLERRTHFTKVGAGWQDAGTLWVESPAQSAMIISLQELLEHKPKDFIPDFLERLHRQIIVGCDYLVMLSENAIKSGYPEGAMSHDLHGHEKDILPNDVVKAVIALYRAVRLLPDDHSDKKVQYQQTADLSYDWLRNVAKPMGDYGMSRFQRNLPEDTPIPDDEWQTRDLVSMTWAALEKWMADQGNAKEDCAGFAQQVMDRQIPESNSENGYYGHFLEFSSMDISEKAWTHGIVKNQFGADIGQFYPNYLMPFIEMLKQWPGHEDANSWTRCLTQFSEGYLIPACNQNPFRIIPLGIFGNEGPIWFCGTFHGTNTIYGYTSALAFELARLLDKPELKEIAYGNLQWLAGLNAGITKKNLQASVVFSTDVPDRVALPASMICNIGNRWAGTWFNTRGVICNGFSTGKQFRHDVAPKKENDGPFSFTDEDWIPHSAGWLTALARMNSKKA